MATFKEYSKYYDLFYEKKEYGKEVSYLLELYSLYSSQSLTHILDIGCGSGSHISKFGPDYTLVGIDRSNEMIELA